MTPVFKYIPTNLHFSDRTLRGLPVFRIRQALFLSHAPRGLHFSTFHSLDPTPIPDSFPPSSISYPILPFPLSVNQSKIGLVYRVIHLSSTVGAVPTPPWNFGGTDPVMYTAHGVRGIGVTSLSIRSSSSWFPAITASLMAPSDAE